MDDAARRESADTGSTLPGTIAELRRIASEDRDVVIQRFRLLTGPTLNQKPPDQGWSIGQCLEHLAITDRLYLEKLEPLLTADFQARDEGGSDALVGSRFGRWFTKQAGPTMPRRFKAPKRFKPTRSDLPLSVVDDFLHQSDRRDILLQRAHHFDLERLTLSSPVTPLLRLRASDALRLTVMHDRRHIRQATRVLGLTAQA